MSLVTLPNLGPDPFTVNASVLNGKVDPLATDYNGNIQNVNIAAGAGIVYTKLTLTDSIVNADINSAAAIASSKLDLSAIAQNLVMNSKIVKLAKGADVASVAGAITLGDDGNYFDITGTNAITSITAKTAGTQVVLQFDSTASLVDGSNLKLNGNFTGAAEAQITLVSDGTNWFEISRNNPTLTPTAANALAGSVIQVVNTQTSAYATGTTALPLDDSTPQNTEGTEFMTCAITPSASTNKLKIDVVVFASLNSAATLSVALFQDTTADALKAVAQNNGGTDPSTITFSHTMDAGTTSSTTFKVRAGTAGGGNVYLNGVSGARIFGGVGGCSITITEVKV